MRRLYLIAYDIAEPRRLNRVRELLKEFSTGGQKSVYECWCTPAELLALRRSLEELIVDYEDRVHIFALDGRSRPHTLGIAVPPSDPEFFYFG
ncbi:MAG TPA: CRISPR-associated endonuclease Cas2 [Candidatus Acidoferrales bacterium]|nr:CRISPR-associated endonuclease Cas2 [Candidatus Acidoferrales bacterium]